MTSKNPLDSGDSGSDSGKSNDIKAKDGSETIEKLLTSSRELLDRGADHKGNRGQH